MWLPMKSAITLLCGTKLFPALKYSVEHTDAGVTKETQTLEFLIRQSRNWLPSVTGNRILFRDVIYNINSVTPDYLHRDYLKLAAEARKAGQNDQY